jgi:hypothetical protein
MFAPWSEPPLVTAPLLLGYATEPVRIRMQGGVGAGGEKPPATRFINSSISFFLEYYQLNN